MEYDLEEAVDKCKEKQKESEAICYSFGVGRVIPLPTDNRKLRRDMKTALDYIKGLEGFIGIHPEDTWHTILIFDTLNNAKKAKNLINHKGVDTGNYIVPILVEKQYIRG